MEQEQHEVRSPPGGVGTKLDGATIPPALLSAIRSKFIESLETIFV